MHLGLVIYESLDTVSGGYLYDRQLVNELRRAGDTVDIISLPWRPYDQCILHNVRPSLRERLRYGRYDVLLQDELNHPSLFRVNHWLRGRVAYPIVAIVHHLRSSERHAPHKQEKYRRIEQQYLLSVDGLIVNSNTTRESTDLLMGAPRPTVVARPAADHVQGRMTREQIQRRTARRGPLRLLFVGNIIPRKGLHTLLRALPLLPDASWQLTIAGSDQVDPVYAAWLRALARSHGLTEHITWQGHIPDGRLWQQMAGHDLLVVPSQYEGFGIVYLEGMAFGLPAIATTAGAAHEIITDGTSGFLVAPDAAVELAGRIDALLRDRRRLGQMSLAALDQYLSSPTWPQSMTAVRRFLLRLSQSLPSKHS